jgi:hypothetical protein
MTRSSKAIVAWIGISLAGFLFGCGKSGLSTRTCLYNGKAYTSGASFTSTDGCNTCSCTAAGAVACTLMGCFSDASPSTNQDVATSDRVPDRQAEDDVGNLGGDAKLGSETAADSRPDLATPDAGSDSHADAASDAKPSPDAADTAKDVLSRDASSPDTSLKDMSSPDTSLKDMSLIDTSPKDARVSCEWQDASVPVGGSVFNGCNTLFCLEDGWATTLLLCLVPDGGLPSCTLPTSITFGYDGGRGSYQDQYKLDSSTGLTITRDYTGGQVDGGSVHTCTPVLPNCGLDGSLSTILEDLAATDVQAAFAMPTSPLYGVDLRPVDGAILSITLASGGSVLVGSPCPSPTMSSCRPIPAGIQNLADDLMALATKSKTQWVCSGL